MLARLMRLPRLGIALDLDGTLVPFAATPADAVPDAETVELLDRVSRVDGVRLMIVTGRARVDVADLVAGLPRVLWAAEHGAWRLAGSTWSAIAPEPAELVQLAGQLRQLAGTAPGARVEVKSFSVCLHLRGVTHAAAREALWAAAELAIAEWLEENPDYGVTAPVEALEVRHLAVHKGTAVGWLRELAGDGAGLLAIGDDITDEDAFAALGAGDVSILVGSGGRPTRATLRVEGPAQVRTLLRWVIATRAGGEPTGRPPVERVRGATSPAPPPLLVVTNRLPARQDLPAGRTQEVGGLVAGITAALTDGESMWLGWSGDYREGAPRAQIDRTSAVPRAQIDHPPAWRQLFYGGFCNRSLWPLLHGFPGRVRYVDAEWDSYIAANEAYAEAAVSLAGPATRIWAHDYHLMLMARALRRRNHHGRVGYFLHVPFPALDMFETLPWAEELLVGMMDYDLIGLHTSRWRSNFVSTAHAMIGAEVVAGGLRYQGRTIRVGVFPIGIEADAFAAGTAAVPPDIAAMQEGLGERRLILGVDRLDYSKGVPERLSAFQRLLETRPEWRRRVSMIQISVPSRADVPEYAELRRAVENLVGRINGEFGEADWVPVRYLYRSYGNAALAGLYRAADVALVTPLRDGMNLVAKEYVAAQDPERPGVLVLSRFAGAAEELTGALMTNPYHRDGLARDLDLALRMPVDERRARHVRNLAAVQATSATDWAAAFLDALGGA